MEQKKKSICKIICNDGGNATGFLCIIPFPDKFNLLPVLITNNHVLAKKDIYKGRKITFTLNDDKIKKEIIIENSRKTFTNENYDITIIEMIQKDNLDFNTFLEIDENIFKENPNDFYRKRSIYLIYYHHDNKAEYSNGLIKNIKEYNIEHFCSTKKGASGCSIINLHNNRVLAIHIGADKDNDWNLAHL